MAPPISRRSKQKSTNSPTPSIPLPGIAVGLFAAIAAGFAASRALRRKRHSQSLQDEKLSISAGGAPPFKEIELDVRERDDSSVLIDANGTISIAQESSKIAALKPMLDAIEEASVVQKKDAKPLNDGEGEDEEGTAGEEVRGDGKIAEEAENGLEFEVHNKQGETMKNGNAYGEKGETAKITVEIEASLGVDGASVEALKNPVVEEKENEGGEEEIEAEGKRTEVEDNCVMEDEDICTDGDDDRSSANHQPSHAFINGRTLDFFEEMPDFKEESSGSNSLSDAVSETSMQEVSSAPVKPFVPTEETVEASWAGAKPDFLVTLSKSSPENTMREEKIGSYSENCVCPPEDASPEMSTKEPELLENFPKADQHLTDLKPDRAIMCDDTVPLKPIKPHAVVGLVTVKPILVEIEQKGSSVGKVDQTKIDLLSDIMDVKGNTITAFEGKVLIKVNGLDEGVRESTTINGQVLLKGSSLSEEPDDLEAMGECEHEFQLTREIGDDFTDIQCKSDNHAESIQIDGKERLDESLISPCIIEGLITNETNLQTGQEGTDGTSDVHSDPDVLATIELLGDKTCVSAEHGLYHGECTKEKTCLGSNTSEERVTGEGILEQPKLQSAAPKLDKEDVVIVENNVNSEEAQSSSVTASNGMTESTELSCEGSADKPNIEDNNVGLSEEILGENRVHAREQEIKQITSCDANDLLYERENLKSLTDSAHVVAREVGKRGVNQHGLQAKGVSMKKVLEYLPLEIGLLCLLIALASYVLWYLEVVPST